MKVWIDAAHPPHPLLFGPVARRLEALGHEVAVTARDASETLDLARERWPSAARIGGPSPKGRRAKAQAIARRARDLRRWAAALRPDVALSHNSYAQIVAARSLGIPIVTAMDYEHQPANHLAFRLAHRVLLPDLLPLESVRRQGARPAKVVRYHGLKEELYLGDFEPDPAVLETIGVRRRDGDVLVAVRAPSFHTLYHPSTNPLFAPVMEHLAARADVRCVVLTRHPEQRAALAALDAPNFTLPEHAVDSRSLMHATDLVIGAGGTMTREAALMGVPTVSIYTGPPPAVDLWLERRGLLRRVTDAAQLDGVERRRREPVPLDELRRRSADLVDLFATATVDAARRRR